MGKLILLSGDYIENSVGMDAIVNAANPYMQYGSGICGAIYRNAGSKLEKYCKETYKTYMSVGEVRITKGFNLNMDIIHVLAPKHYEFKEPLNELLQVYDNLLKAMKDKKYKNVLMCSLGTGIHKYTRKEVAKPLMILLNNFCKDNDINIYFNNINLTVKEIYLNYYLNINGLLLKQDLQDLSIEEIKEYLEKNNLIENHINAKYKDFVNERELEELNVSEKLICLQYTLKNFDVTKKQLQPLLESL